MIQRKLKTVLKSRIGKGKAIILIGARQVGKSTLFDSIIKTMEEPVLSLNCDDAVVRETLANISTTNLKLLLGNKKIILIDEAQRVDDIGMVIKRIVDNLSDVQVLVTGSSTLGIKDRINEPLTGRKFEYEMYPISTGEIYDTYGLIHTNQLLENRLIFGSYPDVLMHPEDAKEILSNLSDSYLYKDILELDSVRKPDLLRKLLIAIALQVGSEVSYNELAATVGSDTKTVERYVDLLEKCFVIFRLPALSRNLRNELKKSKKIFFYDTGIRNAIINNFAPTTLRNDTGSLWENFFIMERIKHNRYLGNRKNYYFWRTSDQKEIDFIEEYDGMFTIFEMKWNPRNKNSKFPQAFLNAYQCRDMAIVTPDNYLEFLIQP